MDKHIKVDFHKNVPRSITFNGIEVPTYQTFWGKTTELRMEIDKLKSRQNRLVCLLIIQGLAIILVSLKQLC